MRVELWHLQGREKLQDGAPGSGRVWAGVKAVNLGDWADVTRRQDPGGTGLGTWTGRRVHGHMDMLQGMLVNLRPAHPARGSLPAVRTPGFSEQVGDEPVGRGRSPRERV